MRTFISQRALDLRQMQQQLQQEEATPPDLWLKKRQDRYTRSQTPVSPSPNASIAEISAEAFQLLAKRKDLELLVVSLYELDRELGERESATLPKDTKPLPGHYHDFLDVFLKEALD